MTIRALAAALACSAALLQPAAAPTRGFSHPEALSRAYDAILDADFAAVPARLGDSCTSEPVFCRVMDAAAVWWQIALDPDDRRHDAEFHRGAELAISMAEAWTSREPERAEAWFALGAALGTRAQWRVTRGERVAAARDGKRIRASLERALAIDPDMHDARFGLGLYRYYAAVAPSVLRWLRWLLLLPGGTRSEGLQQIQDASARGHIVEGEAEYQLHLIYLWYENRADDALAIVRRLQQRYPGNPLFVLAEAEIEHAYFHHDDESHAILDRLIARAARGEINAPAIAIRRAQSLRSRIDRR